MSFFKLEGVDTYLYYEDDEECGGIVHIANKENGEWNVFGCMKALDNKPSYFMEDIVEQHRKADCFKNIVGDYNRSQYIINIYGIKGTIVKEDLTDKDRIEIINKIKECSEHTLNSPSFCYDYGTEGAEEENTEED